jgi:hypothetical protein
VSEAKPSRHERRDADRRDQSAGLDAPRSIFDPIERLRLIAAGIPGAAIVERVLDAPFDSVWATATDFEGALSGFEVSVGRARVVKRDGETVTLESRLPLVRLRQRVDVHVREGWCLMQGRGFVAAMAARPEGERTRFAHLEAARMPGAALTKPLMKLKMVMTGELKRIERLARDRSAR